MKNHALFSSKDKNEKLKCCLLQFLFSALRVNLSYIRSVLITFILAGPRSAIGRASDS